jgi:uncharacterized protein (DUF3820 family)
MTDCPRSDALTLTFGKYKHESIADVFEKDPGYAKWIYNQKNLIGGSVIEAWLNEHMPESPVFQMPWGKYKGKTLAEVYRIEPHYITWLRTSEIVGKQKYLADEIDKFKATLTSLSDLI